MQLYKRIEYLEKQLNETSAFNQTKIENLADNNELIEVYVDVHSGAWNTPQTERKKLIITWNKEAYHIFPKLIDPISEPSFKSAVTTFLKEVYLTENSGKKLNGNIRISPSNDFYDTLKIQFQLLG